MNATQSRRRNFESQAHRAALPDLNTVTEVIAFLLFWPCIGLIAWMALDPYGFRDALLRGLAGLVGVFA